MSTHCPVLIISDAVSSSTGLGRITGDIATRVNAHLKDVCRVATLGYGGPGSRRFKFPQYAIEGMGNDFVIHNLPDVWKDWAGNEPGIIFAIWDCSRLNWFSRPNVSCEDPELRLFLTSAKLERWIYNPVDAEGPQGKLSYPQAQSLLGFDRILAYGSFGENVIRKSLGEKASQERDLSSIPHAIDPEVFYPRDRNASRKKFISLTGATTLRQQKPAAILDGEILVGAVATNQTRKDWGLWSQTCALFLERHPKTWLWVHTDMLERHWSIPALLVDFGLLDRTLISLGNLDDDHMAQAYSACDLTLGIGSGEGFGLPLLESLACGTPVIHGMYAGGAKVVDNDDMLVDPIAFHMEGLYACKRPIFDAKDWVEKMEGLLGRRTNRPSQFDWEVVWPRWEAWFRKGLAL